MRSAVSRWTRSVLPLLFAVPVACDGPAERGAPWPLELTARFPERTSLTLFEPVVVDVALTLPPGVVHPFEPTLPADPVGGCGLRARPRLVEELVDGRGMRRRWRVTLLPQRLGEVTLPPWRVALDDGRRTATPPWTVSVASILDEDDPGDLADPAPTLPALERTVRPRWWAGWLVGGGALLVAVGCWLAFARRVPVRARRGATPRDVARRALDELRGMPVDGREELEAFCIALCQVLRRYFEGQFGVEAARRTSEEVLAELETGEVLVPAARDRVAEILRQCDLVKFGAQGPKDGAGPLLEMARALIGSDVHEARRDEGGSGEVPS